MKQYGLIGKTLSHSFSKKFFTDKFFKEEIKATYVNIELAEEKQLENWLKDAANNFNGINVTIPYKTAVIPYLDNLSEEAKAIGAVNTIHFEMGKSIGYNTDAFGFQQSIKPFLKNIHERALILGTGGAAKAVAYALRKLGITVAFLSRNPRREEMIFSYEEANEKMVQSFPLIINTTPIGMYPNVDEKPDFPIHFVNSNHLIIDLIYNPELTEFLKVAKANGAEVMNGFSMLQHQALKSWEIWNRD